MALPGRHTSKYGNFLCKYDGKDLSVTCIDGSVTIFHDFKLPRNEESFQKNFTCKPEDRQSLCYNFILKRDKENKQYLIVSVTMKLKAYENSYYGNGAISMDINYDHFALAELDETGKLLEQKLIRFDLMNKSKEGTVPEFSQETYKNIWARITNTFSGIRKHFFYRSIPYEVL